MKSAFGNEPAPNGRPLNPLWLGLLLLGIHSVVHAAQPVVTITKPIGGTIIQTPGPITLESLATVDGGVVAKVEYFYGPLKIGTSTNAPWRVSLPGVSAGIYTFNAKATDSTGQSTTSDPITVEVADPPVVKLVYPVDNYQVILPDTLLGEVDPSSAGAQITSVQYFLFNATQTNLLTTITNNSYPFVISNLSVGTYSFRAVVKDSRGLSSTATATNIVVLPGGNRPPSVKMSQPNYGIVIRAGTSIPVRADATDPDGTITNLSLFIATGSGDTRQLSLIATSTNGACVTNITFQSARTVHFVARATDNLGAISDSEETHFVVVTPAVLTPPVLLSNGATRIDFTGFFALLEATSDFTTWTPLSPSLDQNGTFVWVDPGASNAPARFYRGRHYFAE